MNTVALTLLSAWVMAAVSPPAAAARVGEATTSPAPVEIRRIWDRAPHNAFTDLIRFKDQWYCAFREGEGHVSADGRLRVIRSKDARQWLSAALITWQDGDLRDAKLSIAADGRLMLSGAVRLLKPFGGRTHQSVAWFSDDGAKWSEPVSIGDPNVWLWSVTWHKAVAYGIGYHVAPKRFIRLYHSRDGRKWETLADDVFPGGTYANETSLVFAADDRCYCLLRRDGGGATPQLGVAEPPYKRWVWKDLGRRMVGGPKMIQLPDGRLLAGGRVKQGKTGLFWLDPEKGAVREFLALPSGGDTGYPGIVLHENILRVSYYSSHEGKASIYLAEIPAP